jgi:SNF2 family DNA or RNA helicase
MRWLLKHKEGRKPFEVQLVCCSKYEQVRERFPGFGMFKEMGLGKTATELNIFVHELFLGTVDGMAVFCPPSLRGNWRDEATDWGLVDAGVHLHLWPKVPPVKELKSPFIVVMNYESVAVGGATGSKYLEELNKRFRVRITLDESIQIKNPQSVRTKNLIAHSHTAVSRCILSGAPIVQGPHDLWSQLRFIGVMEGKFFSWRNKFCVMGGFQGKKVLGVRKEREGELHELLESCSFRAKKEDWTDLPPKVYAPPRRLEMTKVQLEHYRSMEQDLITFVTELDGVTAIEANMIVTKMGKLQQISSGFMFDQDKRVIRLDGGTPKLADMKELIEQVGTKVLIVAFFRPSIEILSEALAEYRPAVLKGGMTDDQVSAEKKRFNNDSSCRVAILQESSHKYGHTLLGQPGKDRCHTVVFYENSFSLDDRKQMEDRPHRHGQDTTVTYIDYATSQIEYDAIRALQRKEDVAAAIVDHVRARRG